MLKAQITNRANNATLYCDLIPLTYNSSEASSLICIGQDLSIIYETGKINLTGIFVSPSGKIVIILSNRPLSQDLPFIISELQTWDYDKLDSIASDYTYQICGQACRIVDIMAKHGHKTFSDGKTLTDKINQCMENGNFNLLCIGESSI